MDPLTLLSLGLTLKGFLWGGVAGVYSKQQSDLETAKALGRQLNLMDLEWNETQKTALEKADKEDVNSTLAESTLGAQAEQVLGQLGMEQEQNALEYNSASQQIAAQKGSASAQLANSGTRGSSALNAAEMQAEQAGEALQMQENNDRTNEDFTLRGALMDVATGMNNIQNARDEAGELREDYSEGGAQYNIYQKQRDNYYEDNKPDTSFLSYVNAFLNGGNTGASVGSKVGSYVKNWSEATLTSDTSTTMNTNSNSSTYNVFKNGEVHLNKDFFPDLWDSIKDWGSNTGNAIKNFFTWE